ncbi:hypothetical protein A3Q56_06507 [Intoshia linei]|uniref:Solute carrier organic anion transporter family member n=1 Tax=Intoshia linei TaxID=1819745 RepID=A0A177AUT6_9BILA|nr:hypothetical protein A3Q56_06507 [Intoshia linei]
MGIRESKLIVSDNVQPSIIAFPTIWLVEAGFSAVVDIFSKRSKLDVNNRGIMRLRLNKLIEIDHDSLYNKHQCQGTIYYSFAVGGAACGYLLGGIFLTIDEGWWIGFVLSFCICILVGFPLSAFGRYVPEHALIEKNRDRSYSYTSTPLEKFNRNTAKSTINKSFENDPEKTTLDNDEINVLQTLRYFNLQELIPAIKRILTNKVLMLIITANTIDSFLIIGLILFIPKYIETQFNTPASSSSIYAGIAAIPSGIIGTVIGGIIIRNMNVTKRLLFSVVCFGIAVPVMFAFYLKCDTIKITGLNEAYNDRTSIQLNDACNTQCNCTISNIRDLSKSMICAITPEDEKIYFISPCFAGCRGESDNKICNCFHSKWRYPANNDVCHNSMCTVMISVYIIMIGIGILLTFASASSTIQSILRVVKFKDRSLATGVGWMFGRVFGTLPGPILFGLIIDKSCSLWNNTGCKGNSDWICLQYESEKLVKYATILALSCKILSLIVMSLAAFLHHRHCQKRKKSKRNIKYKLDV